MPIAVTAYAPGESATRAPSDPYHLSPREREVLALVVDGRSNREIGATLFISEKTASVHVTHILAKLGAPSRGAAAALAARGGLLEPPSPEGIGRLRRSISTACWDPAGNGRISPP